MLFLGIDLGTSYVKVSVVDGDTQKLVACAQYPEREAEIISLKGGWAEQNPELWWDYLQKAVLKCHATRVYNPKDILSIGISYQMHGLVLVDNNFSVIRNAIIWCDSRAVDIGNKAFEIIGKENCLSTLLNSPGNFTASKLAWLKENEPHLFQKIFRVLLPGDFIAMKLTHECTTTVSALSEGIFWNFQAAQISSHILNYFQFPSFFFPDIKPVFSNHGVITSSVAHRLGLAQGVAVSYKAGDQMTNALSLNVMRPGEVAVSTGTSGVVYGVSDSLKYDKKSRVNGFAHVNHSELQTRIGLLLCINGTGIFNRWIKDIFGDNYTYSDLNKLAASAAIGSSGLFALPFGNGVERILSNRLIGGGFAGLDFNLHEKSHIVRSVQEGIAFAMRYGIDIMRDNAMSVSVVRASKANLFLSEVFTQAFASVNNVVIEFYDGDGSLGAALGAGIGSGVYQNEEEAFLNRKHFTIVEPKFHQLYEDVYNDWNTVLRSRLIESSEE